MSDKFGRMPPTIDSPATNGFTITPANTGSFSQPTRALYVGGAGNLVVEMYDKNGNTNTLTFSSVPAGTLLPIRVKQVRTDSTATNILGLY
jgi:hypothetical protein